MYIQPAWARDELPLKIPENYSGTAIGRESSALPAEPEEPKGSSAAPCGAAAPCGGSAPQGGLAAEDAVSPCGSTAPLCGGAASCCDTAGEDAAVEACAAPSEACAAPSGACPAPPSARPALPGGCLPPPQPGHRPPPPPPPPRGGLLERLPFLAQWLPPRHKDGAPGSDLVLIAGVLLLISGSHGDELLPLLLLLLLV